MTEANKIWDEISTLSIEMFSLPRQAVLHHVQRLQGANDAVFLKLNSSAVLPALEEALAANTVVIPQKNQTPHGDMLDVAFPKWELEQNEGYVIVRRASPPPEQEELQVFGDFVIVQDEKLSDGKSEK